MVKNLVKKIIPLKWHNNIINIKNLYFGGYAGSTYSQEGEDMVLNRLFEYKKNGFYVDVGAHHPMRFSNTYIFYKKGWNGINIDAMPGSMDLFSKIRKRDINLEIPISDKRELLTYFAFNEPALNGFHSSLSNERDGKNGCKIIFKKEMETKTLVDIFNVYLPGNIDIDFLSIDVEGLDFQVIKSNDWDKYRPEIVLVEVLSAGLEGVLESDIAKYMKDMRYDLFAKTINTVFFRKSE